MTQIITTSSTVAGVNITAAINEFIYVGEGVTRASTNSDALRSTLGGADINILGNLVGASDGMDLSDSVDTTGFIDVTIGTTGTVVGNFYGIRFQDDSNSLINHGLVTGTSAGVYNNNGASFQLTNTGTISSTGLYGINNNIGTNFQLTNSGTISSSGSYAVYNNGGSNFQLTNTGTISSTGSYGIFNNGGSNFLLANSGTISSTASSGVRSTGTGGAIVNFGLIESTELNVFANAVTLFDLDFSIAVTVTNYGTLSAAGGVAIVGDLDDVDEIHNFGTVVGDISNGGGDDLVENGGRIQGDVLLGDDNDTYDGEGGEVTGTVFGGVGNDTLTGGDLVDRLDGGANSDTLSGGKGADILSGGLGTDIVDYATSIGGVQVNLQTGAASSFDAAGDVLTGIEILFGSSGDDYLAGDAGGNVLVGRAGDDSLYGRVGGDALSGGAGNDRLFGGMDADALDGGDDDDILIGGAGGDTIDGGAGIDTADYSSSSAAVTMNLQTNVHSGGDAAGDFLVNIERVIGTAFADDIAGSFGDNVMIAGDGVDRLQGRLGLDDLYGGGGNDRLFGGVDNDRLFGGTGNDMLYGGVDDDLFIMENSFGNDQIMDFTNGAEFVDVSAVTGATTATLNVTGGGASNVMVDFGGLDTIEFVGITNIALITEADFIF